MGFSQAEASVVIDLISHYKQLYQPSADEVAKELIMLNVLQKYHAAAENLSDTIKQSGDLKVWITIDAGPAHTDAATVIGRPAEDDKSDRKKSKKNAATATGASTNERPQVNVTLTPTKTAHDVCKELAHRFSGPHSEPTALSLYEYILDGDLHRPLHHTERPFDVVLRWSYWPEADRKHNTLRVQPLGLMGAVARVLRMAPIVPLPLAPLANRGELRYADQRTRTLRPFVLELADGRLTVMRRERGGNCVVPVRDVEVRSVTAYVGAERKRAVQQRWAITLVERDVGGKCSVLRTREAPYFGHVIAGTDTNDQLVWYASIMHSLYGENILPEAEIILT